MKLTLIGFGYVGKAVHNVLQENHDVKIVDPKYNENLIEDDSDGYIVCVPTPSDFIGACDMSYINNVSSHIPDNKPVLIKSTMSLEGWDKLKTLGKSFNFSPEFLTAANAMEDFKNQEYMLLGGPDYDFWKNVFPFPTVKASIEELIMVKYSVNCFLAAKVSFFNEIYNLCKATNIDYNMVASHVSMDRRIGTSHMEVPGPDGKLGFGGACFPKDTQALVATGLHFGSPMTILNEIVAKNNLVRDDI